VDEVTAVSALADPTRRQVYEAVAGAHEKVSRDQVAASVNIGRTLAAHHLDKLAEAGLVEVTFQRGAAGGRPAKFYRRAERQVAVSLPPRSYAQAGELLAEALEKAGADKVLQQVALRHGRRVPPGESMWETLESHGYEPVREDDEILLRNCPFHQLAQEFPPLICGMNLALISGMAQGANWPVTAAMRPQPGYCCVVLENPRETK
jgi:predicted ArsR family transcriptional regulator